MNLPTIISSATQTAEVSRNQPALIISERINPTGRKNVLAALQAGNFDLVRQDDSLRRRQRRKYLT